MHTPYISSYFQSAFSTGGEKGASKGNVERPPLRKYLMDGDFFIGAALAGTLTKLALRYADVEPAPTKQNRFQRL